MFVRPSKFRHVFGCPFKKEFCYEGLKATKSAHDTNFCAVNPVFVAVVVESSGGGTFVVLPIDKTGRVDVNVPKVCGHRAPITDLKWCPHNDFLIASCSDDATIKVWSIPDEGLFHNITEPLADLKDGHHKRVSYIEWHPSARNVLLSAGADHKVCETVMRAERLGRGNSFAPSLLMQCVVWDALECLVLKEITVHQDSIFSISWNHDGSLFASTCKDKMMRIVDPRTGQVVAEGMGHQGNKSSKVVFLNGTQIFTTGFSRSSERQYALWDYVNLSKPIKMEEIDSSCGTIIPFFDQDLNIVYLAGKGDGNIRYVEIIDQPPFIFFLNQFQSSIPQRGLGIMPKRGLDRKKCEIARFYKLHSTKDICEPISMIVPRKSDIFQPDIYPPTASVQPSLTSDEWMAGIDRPPILMSFENGSIISSTKTLSTGFLTNGIHRAEDSPVTNSNRSARSKSLLRENPSRHSRSSSPTSPSTQAEHHNSATDLTGIIQPRNHFAVERRRRRRSRTRQEEDNEGDFVVETRDESPQSSHDGGGNEGNETTNYEFPLKPKVQHEVSIRRDFTNGHNKFSSDMEHGGTPRKVIDDSNEEIHVQNVVLLNSGEVRDESDVDLDKSGSRAMLDCISVDAPDDGVILPSKLRASMSSRQRRIVRGGVGTSSFACRNDRAPNSELQGLIRAGSVREKSRNYSNIMDGFRSGKSDRLSSTESGTPAKENRPSISAPANAAIIAEPAKVEITRFSEFSPQQSRSTLGKSCSFDQVSRPLPAVTARILPLSNTTHAKKLPGKSLSDFKPPSNVDTSVQRFPDVDDGQNESKTAVERKTTIERRHMNRSTIEVIPKHQSRNANNYNNDSSNNNPTSANDKMMRLDSSLSHAELLREFQKQQQEIKKLRSLLEQRDQKIRKMEEEHQMYKYRNRRMI